MIQCLSDQLVWDAWARSSQTTESVLLLLLASLMSWLITAVCSRQPEYPGTPPFWTLGSMNLLASRYVVSLLAMMDQKIFPSTSSREISRNWSSLVEFSSFGTKQPSARVQSPGSSFFFHSVRRSFESLFSNSGQHL